MIMSSCPYLDYKSNTYGLFNSFDKYICKITGQQMDVDDSNVKYTCKCSDYVNCPYYKNR